MKSTELHRKIKKDGWKVLKQDGTSHIHYKKDGKVIVVPFHGSKEVATGTVNKILKDAGLK